MTNRTLTTLAVLLGTFVAIWFGFAEPGVPPPLSVFPDWRASSPDSLRLEFDDQDITLRRTSDSTWVGPDGALDPTGARTLDAFARGLFDVKRGVSVQASSRPAELTTFGLAEVSTSVTIWIGGRRAQLALGSESPLGHEVYAMVNSGKRNADEVFLVSKGVSLLVEQVGRNVVSSSLARANAPGKRETR